MNKEELSAQRAEKWREELRKSRKAKERTDISRFGGYSLPRLRRASLYDWLSGWDQYTKIY